MYIQIWSEQKHPKPKSSSQILTTKEYFEREKEVINNVSGKAISNVSHSFNHKLIQNINEFKFCFIKIESRPGKRKS